jgi:hypothetical protein
MRTFVVSDVKPGRKAAKGVSLPASLEALIGDKVEACGSNLQGLVEVGAHPVVEAAFLAFAHHLPLTLSPDDVWLCLAQGFGLHVNRNAEALRARFVSHQGKQKLSVRRDTFIPGSPDNDWPGVFAEISNLMAEHLGKKRDLVVADFSTTGPVERAASEVVLMSVMRSYFDLSVSSLSGIPSITLLGTPDDWRRVRDRARMLGEFGLEWWVAALEPVLDQFVAAADGDADRGFWQSFVKKDNQSGGPFVTGWINVLFPFLERPHSWSGPTINASVEGWGAALRDGTRSRRSLLRGGPALSDFMCGLSAAPFTWHCVNGHIRMEFLGGFVGLSQDPQTLALRPAIGWAVRHAPPP